MQILKTQQFHRWAISEKLDDTQLKEAISEMNNGLIDACLGSGLCKKRIARLGQGKRSGFRTLLAFHQDARTIFLFGFAKNERENIENSQLILLKKLAKYYLQLSEFSIDQLIKKTTLIEVK